MNAWRRITDWVGTRRSVPDRSHSGEDVAADPALASTRATGGEHVELSGDRGSITGTGQTGEFVGRVAGDDLGYADETGAERRTEVRDDGSHGPPADPPTPQSA